MNMRGVFLHVMADALGSVVVIISALIMWLTEWKYKVYVDPGKLSLLLACWHIVTCLVRSSSSCPRQRFELTTLLFTLHY